MRMSSIILALIGLGVAGGSAQLAREMLTAPPATASMEPQNATVDVVVAARDIARGDAIDQRLLRIQPWPREAVPTGAILSMAELLPQDGGAPRRATRSMVAGEPVLSSRVSAPGERVTILQTLSPDTRAMAIRVDAVTAVGGFITPGDFVDIVLTRGDREELMADTILRNIRVLAVDQTSDETTDRPAIAATVTVEVTAEQGQILALGQRAGTLSLALRNPDSGADTTLDRLMLRDLLPERPAPEPEPAPVVAAEPAPTPPPAPARLNVTIRRGATETETRTVPEAAPTPPEGAQAPAPTPEPAPAAAAPETPAATAATVGGAAPAQQP